MKKLASIVIALSLFLVSVHATTSQGVDLTPSAKAAILIDYETGQILYEKNSSAKLYPASMTKMMSLLLVVEAIHNGKLSWDTEVTASAHASSMGGSQIFLETGEVMTVEDLYKASTVASANDAIVALAEKVGGSEENFAAMMNEKAEQLGLEQTHFVNATGLHDDNHYSCAKDMAAIGRALIQEGQDDILRFTSTYDDYIRADTENKFWLVNTNKLIRTYQGMDGLKTGYTTQSMYCITVTAKRDGLRLIGVAMGEPTRDVRNSEASALLDYGFSTYGYQIEMEKGTPVTTIKVDNGKPDEVRLVTKEAIGHIVAKGAQSALINTEIVLDKKKAPIQAGESVGRVILHFEDGTQIGQDLVAEEAIMPLDFIDILLKTWKKLLF